MRDCEHFKRRMRAVSEQKIEQVCGCSHLHLQPFAAISSHGVRYFSVTIASDRPSGSEGGDCVHQAERSGKPSAAYLILFFHKARSLRSLTSCSSSQSMLLLLLVLVFPKSSLLVD